MPNTHSPQGKHSSPQQYRNSDDYHAYSRNNQDEVIRVRKHRKKRAKWKKPLIITLAVILCILLVGGGAAFAYYQSLNSSIAYEGDVQQLESALTDTTYEDPFYTLVIGSDEWESYGARSDTMLLLRIDEAKGQVTMVSVPRDTPYQIDGQTVKLNQVFAEQGAAACVEAVSQVTGVPIAHYVEVDFSQFSSVVDSLGGILVDVPYAIDYTVYTNDQPTVHIDAGPQVLNGEQAVALARMRTAYASVNEDIEQEAIRQANIRAMFISLIKTVLESTPTEIPGKVQQLAALVQTDIPLNDLISWATVFATKDSLTVYSCTGPYNGGIDAETGLWLTEEAPEAWSALMKAVDAGDDPSNVLTTTEDGVVKLVTTEEIDVGTTANAS